MNQLPLAKERERNEKKRKERKSVAIGVVNVAF